MRTSRQVDWHKVSVWGVLGVGAGCIWGTLGVGTVCLLLGVIALMGEFWGNFK